MNKNYLLFCLISAVSLFGLIKPKTTTQFLAEEITLEDRALTISARLYSSEESRAFLRTDLISQGFCPIEIAVVNQGDHTYALSAASTALGCAKPSDVAWKITKKAIPRGVGLKILSFIFWPMTIASTIDSIHTFKSHTSLIRTLTAKGLKNDDELILPYSVVKRVLYVPKENFYTTFSISLEDRNSDDLVVIPVSIS